MTKVLALLLILVGFIAGVFSTLAAIQFSASIKNVGVIKTVGVSVYADSNLTIPLTEINWGFLEPGEQKNFTCYILSESNIPVVLNVYGDNWQPVNASEFLLFSSTCDGVTVPVDGSVEATFILTVDPEVTGITNFSFDVWVVGVG